MGIVENKCYVIVKKFNSVGCVGVVVNSESAFDLRSLLDNQLDDGNTQVVIISDTETYGEYEPYDIKNSLKEFLNEVFT